MKHALSSRKTQARKLFRNRLFWAAGLVVIGFAILLARMAWLQIALYDRYRTLAEDNRIASQVIPPQRGRIYDRNHVLLADNKPVFVLEVVPEQAPRLKEQLAHIGTLFPYKFDVKRQEKFLHQLRQLKKFEAHALPFELTETEAAHFAALSYQFPGFQLSTRIKRIYPYGTITAHTVGYVGKISKKELKKLDPERYRGTFVIGKSGIEKYYESRLMGRPGLRHVEVNAFGRVVRTLHVTPAQPGQDLTLTLDMRLQIKAYQLLAGRAGAVVALDPRNGEVLAMASSPGYDANLFVDGISYKNYRALLNNPERPLINRPIAGIYPPASTIKPLVLLAALEKNIVTPQFSIFDPGYFKYENHLYRDWKRGGHGRVGWKEAIMYSCDTYFYQLGLKMGINRMHDGLLQFGLGRKTGIDLPGERAGLIPNKEWKKRVRSRPWYNGETVIAAIGQGYDLSTPLQLARATAILANRGTQIIPHLLKQPKEPEGHIPVHDPRNWERVTDAMEAVVHHPRGTAHRVGRHLPFRMAGKTGTAQVISLKRDEKYDPSKLAEHQLDHSLFVGFAPVKDPQIAIAVIIEHGGSGSRAAAPVAAELAKYYLQLKKLDEQNP